MNSWIPVQLKYTLPRFRVLNGNSPASICKYQQSAHWQAWTDMILNYIKEQVSDSIFVKRRNWQRALFNKFQVCLRSEARTLMTSRDNLFARVTHLIGANSTAGKVDKKGEKKFTALTRTTLCCTISVSFDFLLWKFLS